MKKEYIITIIGVLGTIIAALITVNFFIPNRNVEILVHDANSKSPVKNAVVKINEDEKRTGNDGIVIFEKQKRGYLNYIVTKDNYEEYSGTANIKGKFNSIKIELEKKAVIEFGESEKKPTITFSEPKDESAQISPVSVLGTAMNILEDKHCWIVVNPHGTSGWWPQTREVMLKSNNNWSAVAILGGKKGQKFDVHFVLADEQAHISFTDYLTECVAKKDYPETPLPLGAKSIGYITLIKK